MKKLLRYVLPMVALFLIAGTVSGLAGVTPSSIISLRSPAPVLNGPILGGRLLNIGEAGTTVPSAGAGLQRPMGSFFYGPTGSAAYIKTGTAATAWEALAAGSIGGGVTAQGARLARASSLVGPGLTCFREDYVYNVTTPLYSVLAVSTGAVAANALSGGVQTVTTGATASSRLRVNTFGLMFTRPDANKLYWSGRFGASTAVDAQTSLEWGIADISATGQLVFGVCGNTSTANYVFAYDTAGVLCGGTKITTTVSIVANTFHIWEIWTLADGKVHAAVDGAEIAGSPFTLAASPTGTLLPYMEAQNGATAAARSFLADWFVGCWVEV